MYTIRQIALANSVLFLIISVSQLITDDASTQIGFHIVITFILSGLALFLNDDK